MVYKFFGYCYHSVLSTITNESIYYVRTYISVLLVVVPRYDFATFRRALQKDAKAPN